MNDIPLSPDEREYLLRLSRQALERAASGLPVELPELDTLPPKLRENAACFVTLSEKRTGELRGCIGSLEARQPLAHEVVERTYSAAREDYRFYPVRPAEVADLEIEISRLTAPAPLEYDQPQDLPKLLRPNIDGVVLHDRWNRATFLPQVWEKLPNPEEFLNHLCQKMGAPEDLWRQKKLIVEIYHVEEFQEE